MSIYARCIELIQLLLLLLESGAAAVAHVLGEIFRQLIDVLQILAPLILIVKYELGDLETGLPQVLLIHLQPVVHNKLPVFLDGRHVTLAHVVVERAAFQNGKVQRQLEETGDADELAQRQPCLVADLVGAK